jgi:tRNA threonylcarbamoyladenosine biosynthesis protein TsaE
MFFKLIATNTYGRRKILNFFSQKTAKNRFLWRIIYLCVQNFNIVRFEISNIEALYNVAGEFLNAAGSHRQFAFYGEMGSGKTTFIKALCHQLGVTEMVTSPTFAIVNEYQTGSDIKVFHFDVYRIKSTDELYQLGYEDYFFSNHYCFVEWPELIEPLLPEHMVKVTIEVLPNGHRVITLNI